MSYGQNAPCGLQAIKSLISATYNGQTSPYLIASGYTNNIFKGDLVVLNANGYITNIYDVGSTTYQTTPALGVFNGCSYINQAGQNPIDPASPGRMYWPANTATLNGVPAVADIIDDPNVIFNVQSNGSSSTGITQAMIGATAPVAITVSGGIVQGNTTTGQSLVTLNQGTVGTGNNNNLKILRLTGVTGNLDGLQYNNAEVLIQYHFFAIRPVGI
jgi:hypothetical protein